ncbi:hypothetical protein GW17_00058879, partial [Ensete ventricosum]
PDSSKITSAQLVSSATSVEDDIDNHLDNLDGAWHYVVDLVQDHTTTRHSHRTSPRKQETAAKNIVRQRHPWHRRSFAFTGISHWLHPCNTVSRSRPLCTKDMASVSDYPTSSKNMTHDTWHRGVDVENEGRRGMAGLLYVASAIVARTAWAPVTTRLSRIIRDMSN